MSINNSSDIQKKIIRSGDYDIEFYVSLKDIKSFQTSKTYYWFRSGEVHNSLASADGHVLHSTYSKFYRSNQLAEKGHFNYGLKHGLWNTWRQDGTLKNQVEWKKGLKHGLYTSYDSVGKLAHKGYYKNDLKAGEWIDFKTKDTLRYKVGKEYVKEPKGEKEGFFKRLFNKKDKAKKGNTKKKTNSKKKRNRKDTAKGATQKKEGFFKRLFKKKNQKKSKKATN